MWRVLGVLGSGADPSNPRYWWEGVFSHESSWTDFYCLYLPVLETDEAGKDVPARVSSDSFRVYVPNRHMMLECSWMLSIDPQPSIIVLSV